MEPRDLPASVELLVIGGGTAGLVAAKTAASFGADVLLVERDRMGGDCLWTGCVPSKSLIAAAETAARSRRGGQLGVHVGEVRVDFTAVMTHVHDAIHTIEPADSPEAVESSGARVHLGEARFTGPRTATIDGAPIRFGQAIIATGSAPAVPTIPGIEAVDPLTSDSVWHLTELPKRLVVLGGGAIGCELAQAFARLGSAVTLIQRNARLLPKEDRDASSLITASLVQDGVDVHLGAQVSAIEAAEDGQGGAVVLDSGERVPFDRLLVALGRRPRLEGLGVETAGVRVDERGYVDVDDTLRTSNPRIRAAGDVSGLPAFTHIAGVNGSLAATNAALGLARRIDRHAVPRVTFTHPEVATVGILADDAAEHGYEVREIAHSHTDRAIADDRTAGFTRLVVDRRGRLHGATIVGPRAGESIGEAALAVRLGISTSKIASTTHPYPTYSDALWNAAVADVRVRLQGGAVAGAVRVLARLRRFRMR